MRYTSNDITEEPDAVVPHVRICVAAAQVTGRSTMTGRICAMDDLRSIFPFCLVLLAACTKIASTACEVTGGHAYVNLGGFQECGQIYPDAGKVCLTSNECEGSCFLPLNWEPSAGKEAVGTCEHFDTPDDPLCLPIESKHRGSICVEE